MVDPRRIRQLLDRIAEETTHLRRLAAIDRGQLLSDHDRLHAAKYGLVVAVEAAVDAGRHVIASEGLGAPDSFSDVFALLGKAGILADDIAGAMGRAARFRNLLVHQYAEVDNEQVVDVLASRLDDLDGFRVQLAQAVSRGD
ncbi:DUF86 domain-containing protein [soil metagenome]